MNRETEELSFHGINDSDETPVIGLPALVHLADLTSDPSDEVTPVGGINPDLVRASMRSCPPPALSPPPAAPVPSLARVVTPFRSFRALTLGIPGVGVLALVVALWPTSHSVAAGAAAPTSTTALAMRDVSEVVHVAPSREPQEEPIVIRAQAPSRPKAAPVPIPRRASDHIQHKNPYSTEEPDVGF